MGKLTFFSFFLPDRPTEHFPCKKKKPLARIFFIFFIYQPTDSIRIARQRSAILKINRPWPNNGECNHSVSATWRPFFLHLHQNGYSMSGWVADPLEIALGHLIVPSTWGGWVDQSQCKLEKLYAKNGRPLTYMQDCAREIARPKQIA